MSIAGLSVLIVEDEPVVGMALEDMLIDAGAEPVCAGTVEQALSLLASATFNAAILDINVHGVQSYPVAEALVERGVPFVFATGYGEVLNAPEFAHVPTIAKPYSFPDIMAALTKVSGG